MRRRGIRITAQRLAVADVLVGSADHPTAYEVYERVRERLTITVGTVYNTMHMLTMNGLIQPLPFANGTRYDANPEPHANLVCIECGRIIDADDGGMVDRIREKVARKSGFEVISQRLDFYGRCSSCVGRSTQATR